MISDTIDTIYYDGESISLEEFEGKIEATKFNIASSIMTLEVLLPECSQSLQQIRSHYEIKDPRFNKLSTNELILAIKLEDFEPLRNLPEDIKYDLVQSKYADLWIARYDLLRANIPIDKQATLQLIMRLTMEIEDITSISLTMPNLEF